MSTLTAIPAMSPSFATTGLWNSAYSIINSNFSQTDIGLLGVRAFGAVGNGVTDDTNSILSALSACTSGGLVYLPAGKYAVRGDQLVVNKRLTIQGDGDGSQLVPVAATTGALLTITNSAATLPDTNFNSQLNGVLLSQFMVADPGFRTTAVDGIKLVGVDEIKMDRVRVNGLKGYGLKCDSTGAVRESLFHGLRIWWCGDPAQSKPALWIVSQTTASGGDQHNELYFRACKINYSYERHVVIDGLDTLGPRWIFFDGLQVEGIQSDQSGNAVSTASYDLVQVRKAGHGIVFDGGTIGQNTGYVSSQSVGYACLRIGNGSTGVSGQVKLTNVYIGDYLSPQGSGGVGIVADYCQQLSLTGVRFLSCPGGTLAIGTYPSNATPGSTPSANAFNDVVDIDVTTRFGGTDPIGETQKITGRSGDAEINFYNDNVHIVGTGTFAVRNTGAALNRVIQHTDAGNTTEYFGIEETANNIVMHSFGRTTIHDSPLAMPSGSAVQPVLAFSSESSLGFYRSGVSTIAPSFGTLNLATGAVRLSMRTLAASSLTVSAANTNVAVNEAVFTVGGASGASFAIHSGGTVYIFNSALSAKAT